MTSKTPYEQAREMSRERARSRGLLVMISEGRAGCGVLVAALFVLICIGAWAVPAVVDAFGLPKLTQHEAHRPGTKADMLKLIRQCPKARRALGADIDFSYGSEEASFAYDAKKTTGYANFDVPVDGERKRGRLTYKSRTTDGVTKVKRAMLLIDDDKINLKICGGKKKKTAAKAKRGKRAKRRMKANRRFKAKFGKRKRR